MELHIDAWILWLHGQAGRTMAVIWNEATQCSANSLKDKRHSGEINIMFFVRVRHIFTHWQTKQSSPLMCFTEWKSEAVGFKKRLRIKQECVLLPSVVKVYVPSVVRENRGVLCCICTFSKQWCHWVLKCTYITTVSGHWRWLTRDAKLLIQIKFLF